ACQAETRAGRYVTEQAEMHAHRGGNFLGVADLVGSVANPVIPTKIQDVVLRVVGPDLIRESDPGDVRPDGRGAQRVAGNLRVRQLLERKVGPRQVMVGREGGKYGVRGPGEVSRVAPEPILPVGVDLVLGAVVGGGVRVAGA